MAEKSTTRNEEKNQTHNWDIQDSLDVIHYDCACIADLRSLGTQPLISLAKIVATENSDDDAIDHWHLCEILHREIIRLDRCLERLADDELKENRKELMKKKSEAGVS